MWKKRGSHYKLTVPPSVISRSDFSFFYNRSAGTAPQDKCTILFYQENPIVFISWQHPLESFSLAPAAFATSAAKTIRWFNLSHRIVKISTNTTTRRYDVYCCVVPFLLAKARAVFYLKAHQVKKRNRTLFQQQCFFSPFFDLCNTPTLQPQTLQPDRSAALWECMWINAHKKNCI